VGVFSAATTLVRKRVARGGGAVGRDAFSLPHFQNPHYANTGSELRGCGTGLRGAEGPGERSEVVRCREEGKCKWCHCQRRAKREKETSKAASPPGEDISDHAEKKREMLD